MPPSPIADQPSRSVLIIGSEALPFSKTGGLADVLGALPQALARLGWDVTVVTPRYRGVQAGEFRDRFPVTIGGYYGDVTVFDAAIGDGARVVLVDEPGMFDREFPYAVGSAEYPDNPRRFALLVRAAFEQAIRRGQPPSIVHAHDWQAGLAPLYLRTMYAANPVLSQSRSVMTIHNVAYQGTFDPAWIPQLDLSWDLYSTAQLEYWGRICFLKAGVVNADAITTVSPQYARELQTPEGSVGFDGILRARADRLFGVLNGIDTTKWDPAHDRYLPQPYSADDLSGKRRAKAEVLAQYGLPVEDWALDRPLIGMISRMIDQKGLNLIAQLAADLPYIGASFVILGTGEAHYQDMWRWLASVHPRTIGVRIGFDEGLSHLIEAGADMFLMPSLFEPCGLNQMYSLRYGTVPIVRRVGGLADTVVDHATGQADANGFVFDDYIPSALMRTLQRALDTFRDRPAWRALQAAGMRQDLSWDRSAREYVKIYQYALSRGRA
jgi:starch synthase